MSAEDLKAVLETHAPRLADNAIEDLTLLLADIQDVSPAVLPAIVGARLDSPRFKHFLKPTGPQAGSLEHTAAQFQARDTGGFRRGEGVRNLAGGLASHVPPSHSDLQGGGAPVQQSTAPSLARSIFGHLARQQAPEATAYQVPGVSGIPSYRHTGIPKKNRGR